jgi:quercetin dioxygenase-like cupin family protein
LERSDDHVLINIVEEIEPSQVDPEQGWRSLVIRFLDGTVTGSANTCLFRATFPPGAVHARHSHPNADEFFYLISGNAAVGAGDEEHLVGPGTVQFIPAGKVHWLRNVDEATPVEVVGVYVGARSLEGAGYDYAGEVVSGDYAAQD